MGQHMLHADAPVKKALSGHLVSPPKPGEAALAPNPYSSQCPTRMILDRIADKWTVLVLGLLCRGPSRFNQLRREIEGMTQKMLSQTLKAMERDGLVSRKVTPTAPVSVEYEITPLGETLAATLEGLQRWATDHIGEVVTARRVYDDAIGARNA
jgi:DNA-binding HxlR family transcriptional regulator